MTDGKLPDHTICPVCLTHFGYEDTGRSHEELRESLYVQLRRERDEARAELKAAGSAALKALVSAQRKVLSPELLALVEAECRRALLKAESSAAIKDDGRGGWVFTDGYGDTYSIRRSGQRHCPLEIIPEQYCDARTALIAAAEGER